MVARNKGQITISNKELDQLLLDLSTTSSQMTELQENYAHSRSRSVENADAAKAQQITAVRHDREALRRDLVSARKEERLDVTKGE
jgi:hypothetical protein